MHRNKYETNYAPVNQKYDTVNTILNNKRPDHVNGDKPALQPISVTFAHRSVPLHPIFGSLRSALRSDNKVQNIQN